MRGCVAAFLLLILSVPVFPQCAMTPVASVQLRSTIFDLAADGSRLWAATSYGLALYDLASDPPLIADTIALAGTTRVVRAAAGTAYAASGSAIQIVRVNGNALQIVAVIDAGATVNDFILTPRYLYAATSNGIAQYDLINPNAPARTSATFATSGANVAGLALSGDTLYAADGDASVEVFNLIAPALPAKTGTLTSLARPVAVTAADGRIYVSDGQQTEIFLGSGASAGSVGTFAFGATSVVPLTSTAVFAAGIDRRLRAFDLTNAGTPVELFRAELAPTSGTVNRVNALVTAGGRLYAGAGDIGLLDYDLRQFTAPYPVRSYSTIATGSVTATNTRAYFGRGAGVAEYSIGASGALTELRSWDKSRADAVHDVDNDFLLTSSDKTLTMWTLTSTTPIVVGTATFASPVRQAVLSGTTAYAVLDDKTMWLASLIDLNATPQRVISALAPQFIVRSGPNIAFAELRADGTTAIGMLGSPTVASVQGLATAGIALSGTNVAVWTFRGLTLVNFLTGSTTPLPGSSTVAATRLALNGATLVETTDSGVTVWDTVQRRVVAQYALSSGPAGAAIAPNGNAAPLAMPDGVSNLLLTATSRTPSLFAAPNANVYVKKIVATAVRVVLFDGRNADIYDSAMAYRGGIHVSGTADVTASDAGTFTLTNTLGVNAYTRDGEPLGAALIAESGASPQAIHAVGTAVWASIIRGCPLNCEKKTVVFDARGALGQTVTLNGAIKDVAVAGQRAYVLTEVPDEIRVLDVSDPAHPVEIAKRAVEGTRAPVSIAFANGTVYVLGDKLYTYTESLDKGAELLGAYVDDPLLGVTYADQRLRIQGTCVAMTGRAFSPQLFTAAMQPQIGFATPSASRSIAAQPGRLYVLTDHSLEVWAFEPPRPPARRRAAP